MNKYTKEVFKGVQQLCKVAESLIDSEYGYDVKKDAEKTVDKLVNDGIVAAENRDKVAKRLTYTKHASHDGLRQMADMLKDAQAKSASISSLGSPDSGVQSNESESADDYWDRQFG